MSFGHGAKILRLGVAGAVSAAYPAMAVARPVAGAFSMAPAHVGHLVPDGAVQGIAGTARFADRFPWAVGLDSLYVAGGDSPDAVEVKPRVFEIMTFAGLRDMMTSDPFGKYLAYRTPYGRHGIRFFPGFDGMYHHDLLERGEGFVVGAGFVMMTGSQVMVDGMSTAYPTRHDRVDYNGRDSDESHPLDPNGNLGAVVSIFESLSGRDIPVVVRN